MIVAHPDDETLWAGGTLLSQPEWQCFVACLCRGGDTDRAPRFHRALAALGAKGAMADLDDGPDQHPLPDEEVANAVLDLLPDGPFDLILTHGVRGEYTRHRRHEEVSRAVSKLWRTGQIGADELWLFAYEDGGGRYLPRPIDGAPRRRLLPREVWQEKRRIVTDIYGFSTDSFEARSAGEVEAFWGFRTPDEFDVLLDKGAKYEGPGPI